MIQKDPGLGCPVADPEAGVGRGPGVGEVRGEGKTGL